jgi:hypothetical protein
LRFTPNSDVLFCFAIEIKHNIPHPKEPIILPANPCLQHPQDFCLAQSAFANHSHFIDQWKIKAAEDLQTLIRQLQEFWLFGQLNTLGDSAVKAETDRDSEAVAKMIKELLERREAMA